MFQIIRSNLALALIAAIASVSLSGCQTFNSQILDLHPEVEVKRQLPKDTRIEIQAIDMRKSGVIGHRLTGDEPSPQIILKNPQELLTHTAEHALEDTGIRRFYSGEFKLVVSLLYLNYKVTKQTLKQKVDVDMKLKLELSKGDKSYTGTYATDKNQTFLKTPSEQENEQLIGDVVTQTMTRAFNDPQLLDFIQFN